jgi:prepilin peptidase CpaA
VLLGGLVAAPAIGGLPGLADAIAGCLLLALPYVLLFVFFGGGAGDAKLMGAIGTWLGVVNGIAVLISVLLSGAVIAIGFALAKKQFGHVLANVVRIVSTTAFFFAVDRRAMLSQTTGSLPGTQDMQTIPYGIAIFVGTCIAAAGVLLWRA